MPAAKVRRGVPRSFSGFRRYCGSVARAIALRGTAQMCDRTDYEGSEVNCLFYAWEDWQLAERDTRKAAGPVMEDQDRQIIEEWKVYGLGCVRDALINLYSVVNGHQMDASTIKSLDIVVDALRYKNA